MDITEPTPHQGNDESSPATTPDDEHTGRDTAVPEPGDQAGVRAYAINYFLAGDFASSLAGNNDFALQYRSP